MTGAVSLTDDLGSPAAQAATRALRLVEEWAALHKDEVRANWERARARVSLDRIDSLP